MNLLDKCENLVTKTLECFIVDEVKLMIVLIGIIIITSVRVALMMEG